ncbi:hypothetical protein [Vibrio fortis]|uniref:hypothetical protein n=1 Tax=Vibrio fortis TaxID=212667 RepID=UPI003EBC7015
MASALTGCGSEPEAVYKCEGVSPVTVTFEDGVAEFESKYGTNDHEYTKSIEGKYVYFDIPKLKSVYRKDLTIGDSAEPEPRYSQNGEWYSRSNCVMGCAFLEKTS